MNNELFLAQIILTGILVIITGIYVWRTHVISQATEKQAEASMKTVKQMMKPRLIPDLFLLGAFREGRQVQFQATVHNDGNGPCFDVNMCVQDDSNPPSILTSFGKTISVLRSDDYKEWLDHSTMLDFPHSDKGQRRYLVINFKDIDGQYETRLPFILETVEGDKPYARLESISKKLIRKFDYEDELP